MSSLRSFPLRSTSADIINLNPPVKSFWGRLQPS